MKEVYLVMAGNSGEIEAAFSSKEKAHALCNQINEERKIDLGRKIKKSELRWVNTVDVIE
jgi:hypothetical protein